MMPVLRLRRCRPGLRVSHHVTMCAAVLLAASSHRMIQARRGRQILVVRHTLRFNPDL